MRIPNNRRPSNKPTKLLLNRRYSHVSEAPSAVREWLSGFRERHGNETREEFLKWTLR